MAWVIDSYKPREMTKAEKDDFNLRNERIVDTAGFVPLHVRMQRMIEQGEEQSQQYQQYVHSVN